MERSISATSGTLRVATPDAVRSFISRWWLADATGTTSNPHEIALGEITLRPHQQSAVARLAAAIKEFGGALLGDEVGTGKTFIALAVARHARSILVVAPASLEDMWRQSAQRAGIAVAFTSFELLSRRLRPHGTCTFLIVDEAHHARNPLTARYGELSALASNTPTLLLSATPVHNRSSDLPVLLALFLGSRAGSLSDSEISRCVIRREREIAGDGHAIPVAEEAEWVCVTQDDALPAAVLALSPPLPPRDGGDGGVLIARSLIRQWSSSESALLGGLRRRLQKTAALIASLECGVFPSDAELRAWVAGEDSMQLAFPQLIAPPTRSAAEYLGVALAHREGLLEIFRSRDHTRQVDQERAAALLRIAKRHEGVKIVAFSQYSDTVNGLFRSLAGRGRSAALTAGGARVAGGTMSRRETLDCFAPRARLASPPSTASQISLLLTTDILSEGVNLQDAGVVVHLDIPWTPARLVQRTGRIVRLESEHRRVWSYVFKPPASAETLLRFEQIIADKLSIAQASIGGDYHVLPPFGDLQAYSVASASPVGAPVVSSTGETNRGLRESARAEVESRGVAAPTAAEAIRRTIATWQGGDPDSQCQSVHLPLSTTGFLTAVAAKREGFLAACVLNGRKVLLTSNDGHVTGDLHAVSETVTQNISNAESVSRIALRAALSALHSHFRAVDAMRGITPGAVSVTQARRALLRRIATVSIRSQPHLRGRAAAAADRSRAVVLATYGIAAEQALCQLASSKLNDEDWLESIEAFGAEYSLAACGDESDGSSIAALILYQCSRDT